jgi:hypothetical protein
MKKTFQKTVVLPVSRPKLATEIGLISGEINMSKMSLDDLVIAFRKVEVRADIVKGMILVEARKRFDNDRAFGQWVKDNDMADDSQQVRNSYMHVARFFCSRDTSGISVSVCQEIAAPKNKDVAEKAYQYALGRGLTRNDVIGYINQLRSSLKEDKTPRLMPTYNEPAGFTLPETRSSGGKNEVRSITRTAKNGELLDRIYGEEKPDTPQSELWVNGNRDAEAAQRYIMDVILPNIPQSQQYDVLLNCIAEWSAISHD